MPPGLFSHVWHGKNFNEHNLFCQNVCIDYKKIVTFTWYHEPEGRQSVPFQRTLELWWVVGHKLASAGIKPTTFWMVSSTTDTHFTVCCLLLSIFGWYIDVYLRAERNSSWDFISIWNVFNYILHTLMKSQFTRLMLFIMLFRLCVKTRCSQLKVAWDVNICSITLCVCCKPSITISHTLFGHPRLLTLYYLNAEWSNDKMQCWEEKQKRNEKLIISSRCDNIKLARKTYKKIKKRIRKI